MPTEVLFYRNPVYISENGFDLEIEQVARALDDGRWVSGWTGITDLGVDGEDADAYVRIFDTDATSLSPDLLVNQTTTGEQKLKDIVTLADGTFVAIWTSYGSEIPAEYHGLYMRHFDATGAALGTKGSFSTTPGCLSRNSRRPDWPMAALSFCRMIWVGRPSRSIG